MTLFQSPRSGQICSNMTGEGKAKLNNFASFNPLDRVKFVQILEEILDSLPENPKSFNPLDRVKFVQMWY